MTPEQLKQIAEYMGYEAKLVPLFDPPRVHATNNGMMWFRYNPLTNPEQLLELIEKTKLTMVYVDDMWTAYTEDMTSGAGHSESLAEAVCQTVLEMIRSDG